VDNIVRKLLPYAFLPATLLYSRLRPSIRILMYHRVSPLPEHDQLTVTPERFEEQMSYLAGNWRVIGLAQAVTELANSARIEPAVVVTFDDGYRDNLTQALPVLRKYRVPATIFVTGRFCDQTMHHPRYPSEQGRLHLDWDEVRRLAQEPGITIGSHTLTHPYLTRLDEQQARAEVFDSRDAIAAQTGTPVGYFCYPSGDVTAREAALVEAAGYHAAVTVAPGPNHHATPRYMLRRTEVTNRDGANELALKLSGAFDPIHLWLHSRRERSFAQARLAPSAPDSARGAA
jgi:peptidoglycan/xylan/chitin deacetylase (PgdA/CDA1 family)